MGADGDSGGSSVDLVPGQIGVHLTVTELSQTTKAQRDEENAQGFIAETNVRLQPWQRTNWQIKEVKRDGPAADARMPVFLVSLCLRGSLTHQRVAIEFDP
jgi:hypothetical protein